jgi:hypothetical protein
MIDGKPTEQTAPEDPDQKVSERDTVTPRGFFKKTDKHGSQGFRWSLLQEEIFPNGEYSLTEGIALPQGILLRTTLGFNAEPKTVAMVWLEGVNLGNIRNNISAITID